MILTVRVSVVVVVVVVEGHYCRLSVAGGPVGPSVVVIWVCRRREQKWFVLRFSCIFLRAQLLLLWGSVEFYKWDDFYNWDRMAFSQYNGVPIVQKSKRRDHNYHALPTVSCERAT